VGYSTQAAKAYFPVGDDGWYVISYERHFGPEPEFVCQSQRAKYAHGEDMVELSTCSGFCPKALDLVGDANYGQLVLMQKPCIQGHVFRHSKANPAMK